MTGVQKIEHASLYVKDLKETVEFYRDVMGLVEMTRTNGRVYLGCGGDEQYDLSVEKGGTGVRSFTIRVPGVDELDEYISVLEDHDVEYMRDPETEPMVESGVQFSLPSDISMNLAVVDKPRYVHSCDRPYSNGQSPVDLDHITLASDSIKEDVRFLRDILDWNVSDVFEMGPDWFMAFTRSGDHHHDVGFLSTDDPEATLHHLAWSFSSIDHMKRFMDSLANAGHSLELGLGRHYAGDNLFGYFREPGGNRFELTAEVATLDDSTPTEYHDLQAHGEEIISAWGGASPDESFNECM